jgi:hypothetical protein
MRTVTERHIASLSLVVAYAIRKGGVYAPTSLDAATPQPSQKTAFKPMADDTKNGILKDEPEMIIGVSLMTFSFIIFHSLAKASA